MNTPELKALLRAFVAQRPGFEHGNYNTLSAYRADQRRAMNDKADALALINAFPDEAARGFLTDVLKGRLSLEGDQLEYTAGQYYPTEYRAAVCRAVSDALRALSWAQSQERLAETRKRMARIVGRGCANRWFS
jgi:hypothetical protein